jgi:hypothetical protein
MCSAYATGMTATGLAGFGVGGERTLEVLGPSSEHPGRW